MRTIASANAVRVDNVSTVVENQEDFVVSDALSDGFHGNLSPPNLNPSTRATADGHRAGSDSEASSTSQQSPEYPRTKRGHIQPRTLFQSRGPVSVTSR